MGPRFRRSYGRGPRAVEGISGNRPRERLEIVRAATPPPPDRPRELLDWDELDRLSNIGIDIEAHGASHAILTGLPPAEVSELRACQETLRQRGHGRHGLLAYPNGGYDERVRAIAREVGYRAALTTEAGLACGAADPMALPRLGLHDDVSRTRAEFLERLRDPT